MKKEINYDSSRPLMRLEKGDKVYIRYYESGCLNEKDKIKYKTVPHGYYEGVYLGNYNVECKEYPELSGKYNYWHGDRWGSSALLYADEKKFN